MEEIKFNPCMVCIESLREKLFKMKTRFGMIPFNKSKPLIKRFFYDIYTGYDPTKIADLGTDKFNIEHVVPASIIAPDVQSTSEIFIDTEPYHDLNILFPTLTDINTLRANYVYGNISRNRRELSLISDIDAKFGIINKNNFYGNYTPPNTSSLIKTSNISRLPKNYDNYILSYPGPCPIGQCIFQPAKIFSGDIARIVFYTYLMYGINPTKRPFTNKQPWLGIADKGTCSGFPFDKFEKFFFEHLKEYYFWAKEDPISLTETNKNKKIIELSQVPNIFVGYLDAAKCQKSECNLDDYYTISSFMMIEDLFFGKLHDHKIYTDLEFPVLPEIKPKLTMTRPPTYSIHLFNTMAAEIKGSRLTPDQSTCAQAIVKEDISGTDKELESAKKIIVETKSLPKRGGFINYKFKII